MSIARGNLIESCSNVLCT